jgi:GntR family transcriptional regulator
MQVGVNLVTKNILPLYYTVYLVLRQRLTSKNFELNVAMPSEISLASEFKVSRLTIRRALEQLEKEGMVQRIQGKGTFATVENFIKNNLQSQDIENLLKHLSIMGSHTTVRLLSCANQEPTSLIANQLELSNGMKVQKSVRIRSFENKAFSYLTAYVPEIISNLYLAEDLGHKPLLELFKIAGITIKNVSQTISAVVAEPHVAKELDVPIGTPLISVHRLVRDSTSIPVEYLHALYRPDRYEYRMQISEYKSFGSNSWATTNVLIPTSLATNNEQ